MSNPFPGEEPREPDDIQNELYLEYSPEDYMSVTEPLPPESVWHEADQPEDDGEYSVAVEIPQRRSNRDYIVQIAEGLGRSQRLPRFLGDMATRYAENRRFALDVESPVTAWLETTSEAVRQRLEESHIGIIGIRRTLANMRVVHEARKSYRKASRQDGWVLDMAEEIIMNTKSRVGVERSDAYFNAVQIVTQANRRYRKFYLK